MTTAEVNNPPQFNGTKRYNDFSSFIRSHFNERVQKISLNTGFTCPNRDGTKGFGGCTYCNNNSFNPDYFLHLLVNANSTFKHLDVFLRGIWLECCGHMSAFSRRRHGDEINIKHKVEDIVSPGVELNYQYDFGSTT